MMETDEQRPVYLYLLKWDDRMRSTSSTESCAPGSKRISAISQDKWHGRWHHAKKASETKMRLLKECLNLLR